MATAHPTTDKTHFHSAEEEISYWKEHAAELDARLKEALAEHEEFLDSSKELEDELEREASKAEKDASDAKRQTELFRIDAERWKEKYAEEKRTSTFTITTMQAQLAALQEELDQLKIKRRDLELQNDDLERHERETVTTLTDFETKFSAAMERTAMLESELEDMAEIAEENHRLRDELRDQSHDLEVIADRGPFSPTSPHREAIEGNQASIVNAKNTPSTDIENPFEAKSTTGEPTKPKIARRDSTASAKLRFSVTPKASASIASAIGVGVSATPSRSNSSEVRKPIRMVRDMLDRVKSLESRLASCRDVMSPLFSPAAARRRSQQRNETPTKYAKPPLDPTTDSRIPNDSPTKKRFPTDQTREVTKLETALGSKGDVTSLGVD